jgi:hypothetical protein
MTTQYLLVDTNTFLHYLSLDQIDWIVLFPNRRLVLVICPPVIRELNKHKDAPRTPKLRDRAAAALGKLTQWEEGTPTIFGGCADLQFRAHDAGIDFSAFHLINEVQMTTSWPHLSSSSLRLEKIQ